MVGSKGGLLEDRALTRRSTRTLLGANPEFAQGLGNKAMKNLLVAELADFAAAGSKGKRKIETKHNPKLRDSKSWRLGLGRERDRDRSSGSKSCRPVRAAEQAYEHCDWPRSG